MGAEVGAVGGPTDRQARDKGPEELASLGFSSRGEHAASFVGVPMLLLGFRHLYDAVCPIWDDLVEFFKGSRGRQWPRPLHLLHLYGGLLVWLGLLLLRKPSALTMRRF